MNDIIFSVIIPVFNGQDVIVNSINSALDQNFKDLEIIVVDDGSTDDTKNRIMSIQDERVKYFYKANGGQGSARNFGIMQSKGEFLAFLDADDIWTDNKLIKQLELFRNNDDIGMVYGDALICGDKALDNKKSSEVNIPYSGDITSHLLNKNFITNSSVAVRKKILKDENLFNSLDIFREVEDYLAWLDISVITRIGFIDSVVVKYYYNQKLLKYSDKSLSHYKIFYMFKNIFVDKNFSDYRANIFKKLLFEYLKYIIYKCLSVFDNIKAI